ncbi:MAG: hypothetical protein DRO18_05685 [Thermoprotei archaeon]|nr:MAG: hypothetical protein DRO18_05685 [Thermoprotei archaeon]
MQIEHALLAFLLGISPLTECRIAIITAFILSGGASPDFAVLTAISVAGNLIVPFIAIYVLLMLEKYILNYSGSNSLMSFIKRLYIKYILRVKERASKYVGRWGYVGLALFVGIPLPFTGAWTGSLAAYILNLEYRKAVIANVVGIFIAASIVVAALLTGNYFVILYRGG